MRLIPIGQVQDLDVGGSVREDDIAWCHIPSTDRWKPVCVSRAKAIIIVINQSDMEFRRVFVGLIRVLLMSIRWGSDLLRPVGVRGRDVPEAHQ